MPVICGPKCSACCAVLSGWGIIMLALLGVFFYIRSPILSEDLPINEKDWENRNFSYGYIKDLYEQNAFNCWIAAGLYAVTFIISVIMIKVNQKRNYAST
ncbi:hypothetical protein HELRODRAFT_105257 [Helobdella robusta]|uniref:Uncharacterized protein n=1 Tax=Helobdella robusta TaxID=6412 RepID=T1EDS5_HELRO|nr:hypothetical protein HELRODRAFT_105257 [Helobdella robusta]ESO12251.1 hypothetical protein HELRODRAFT_105257 [Helobdella robusta]